MSLALKFKAIPIEKWDEDFTLVRQKRLLCAHDKIDLAQDTVKGIFLVCKNCSKEWR